MMNSKDLATLLWVAELGGIRRAAEHLHLSQPAVSARIAKLEQILGKPLFERLPSGMRCTRAGERLLVFARQSYELQQQIHLQLFEKEAFESELRLGVSETIVQAWLPEFLEEIHASFPCVDVSVTVDISANLREQLLARSLDLAVLMGPVSEFTVENKVLPCFELSWYRSARVESANDNLPKQPVICYAKHTRPYREISDELLQRYDPEVRLFPSSSLFACMKMIEAGLGVGAMPRLLGDAACQRGELQSFDPGWVPPALHFTASYVSTPRNLLAEQVADIAAVVAARHA